nr:hypothetical protein [Noviherbaspirillum malthae]
MPDQFFLRVSKPVLLGAVDAQVDAVTVDCVIAAWSVIIEIADFLRTLLQCLLHLPALGNVARHDQPAPVLSDSDTQFNGHDSAILVQQFPFQLIYAQGILRKANPDVIQQRVIFRSGQAADMLGQQLVAAIPEHLAKAAVNHRIATIWIGHEDAVGDLLEDRSKQLLIVLAWFLCLPFHHTCTRSVWPNPFL